MQSNDATRRASVIITAISSMRSVMLCFFDIVMTVLPVLFQSDGKTAVRKVTGSVPITIQ